jgi:hypothetical protein
MAELVAIDTQARGMGIDLDLADAVTKRREARRDAQALVRRAGEEAKPKGPTGGGSDVVILRDEREGVAQSMELALDQRVLASRGNDGIEYKPKSRGRAQVRRALSQAVRAVHVAWASSTLRLAASAIVGAVRT